MNWRYAWFTLLYSEAVYFDSDSVLMPPGKRGDRIVRHVEAVRNAHFCQSLGFELRK